MMKWLDRLTHRGARTPQDPFVSLRAYPPYAAPHIGPPTSWTRAQAEANLDHLVLHRGARLIALGDWLRAHAGIDIRPALLGGAPDPLLDALDAWVKATWPALFVPAIAKPEVWLRSTRAGDEIVYSLLLDIALLLGELVLVRREGYRWGLDLDPLSERDGMRSWQRPILLLPAREGVPPDIGIDFEELVVGRYWHPNDVMDRLLDPWKHEVIEAASGAKEDAWIATQTARPRSCRAS